MSNPSVAHDWRWSDKFIPTIRAIVGPYLLATAPLALDRTQAADLIVLNGRNVTIACRVRRAAYSGYADQITLRSSRPSGAKSEFEKIAEGYGTWLFYGIADAEGPGIKTWSIVDLNAFRAHLIMNPRAIVHGEHTNASDGTAFRWYKLSSFPAKPPILIASNATHERRTA